MYIDEYYDFKYETAKKFDSLIKEKCKKISDIKIYGDNGKIDNIETDKLKKEVASELLNYSKGLAIKEIQKRTKFVPKEDEESKEEKKERLKEQKLTQKERIFWNIIEDEEE